MVGNWHVWKILLHQYNTKSSQLISSMPDPVKVTLKTFLKTDYRMKKIGTLIIEKPSDMFQISITELFMLIAIVNAVDIMIRIQKTSGRLKLPSRKDCLKS